MILRINKITMAYQGVALAACQFPLVLQYIKVGSSAEFLLSCSRSFMGSFAARSCPFLVARLQTFISTGYCRAGVSPHCCFHLLCRSLFALRFFPHGYSLDMGSCQENQSNQEMIAQINTSINLLCEKYRFRIL